MFPHWVDSKTVNPLNNFVWIFIAWHEWSICCGFCCQSYIDFIHAGFPLSRHMTRLDRFGGLYTLWGGLLETFFEENTKCNTKYLPLCHYLEPWMFYTHGCFNFRFQFWLCHSDTCSIAFIYFIYIKYSVHNMNIFLCQ